jgi:predicted PhzF superfamily epimerase YddE/YHI9
VTGSLNAGLAQWLLASGRASGPYVASQGAALGRAGRIHVEPAEGEVWIGGAAVTRIEGRLTV